MSHFRITFKNFYLVIINAFETIWLLHQIMSYLLQQDNECVCGFFL